MITFTYGRNAPAMTNTERQRLFRKRNPGYYRRLHAKRRAHATAMTSPMHAKQSQAAQAPLMLPAPVEPILIPGLSAIPTMTELERQREAILIERPAA